MPDAADFNLNLLKTFLSLYRERNMTRAARELGLAVSTVSEHLRMLREAYGDPSFCRPTRVSRPPSSRKNSFLRSRTRSEPARGRCRVKCSAEPRS